MRVVIESRINYWLEESTRQEEEEEEEEQQQQQEQQELGGAELVWNFTVPLEQNQLLLLYCRVRTLFIVINQILPYC
jgi:hypothetical protein